jgi:hypothetical protein
VAGSNSAPKVPEVRLSADFCGLPADVREVARSSLTCSGLADNHFFRTYPDRRTYIRACGPFEPIGVDVGGGGWLAAVREEKPGTTIRRYFHWAGALPREFFQGEGVAAGLFDFLTAAQGRNATIGEVRQYIRTALLVEHPTAIRN